MTTGFRLEQCSAVITGASSGLGLEFARQLATCASSLLLVARRGEVLQEVMKNLQTANPALKVNFCEADLATDAGLAKVALAVDGLEVKPNLLINNAGMGDYGDFVGADPGRLRMQMDLNMTAVVMLSHAIIPRLVASAERPAAILNVSSLAGNVPMPDLAVYAASKAFVTSFSEALRVELASRRIIVSALCPGPTPTNFGKNARRADGSDTNRSGQGLLRVMPEVVVRRGLEALCRNAACVFPGLGVSIAAPLFRILPRPLMRWLIERRHRLDHSPSPP